ncbi:hypothetical protein B0H67DRAFT_442783, partial [Lasiosphaeris hirsuta]
ITAQCHCKAVHFTITVPYSCLPLATHLCHCDICRYVHGTLCCFHAPLPNGISPQFIAPSSLAASCTGYRHASSPASERFFCKTCGCHMGDADLVPDATTGQPEWRITTSIFTTSSSTFAIRSHVFPPASHPSLAAWLPRLANRPIPSWTPAPSDPSFPPRPSPPPARERDPADGTERLRAQCHCAGVSFTLPRPNHPALAGNKTLARYVSPADPARWVACLDACDDCRLTAGAHVVAWTFVPLAHLAPRVPPDFAGFGTLVAYASSPGVLRAFCGVCGATVFYRREDPLRGEAWVVHVAVGVLRSVEGPAAEDWLTWRTGRVAFLGDGRRFDGEFAEALDDGFRAW